MTQEELDALSASFRQQGLTWNQTNFTVAIIRNYVEPLRQRNGDLVTGLQACDEQVVTLHQQLDWVRNILASHGYDGPLGDGCCPLSEWLSERDDLGESLAQVKVKNEVLIQQLNAAQAEIDELMLEYCPNEMTKEQLDEWARHQRAVSEDETKQGEEDVAPANKNHES